MFGKKQSAVDSRSVASDSGVYSIRNAQSPSPLARSLPPPSSNGATNALMGTSYPPPTAETGQDQDSDGSPAVFLIGGSTSSVGSRLNELADARSQITDLGFSRRKRIRQ